ncbi:MAG: ABC-type sugar transport system periplasmic component-like protein [Paenibacillaceae bacterium]|jgi:ABC-type glycerol-3-phosphate transport system substrate-binding protein|nr:ABC-type sugar transport system periplasmic component-like protein [Paenibacillaceae bacterium]
MVKKRMGALALAALLPVGALAGCSTEGAQEPGEAAQASQKPVEQKKYTIKLFSSRNTPNPDSEVMKLIQEKIGGHTLSVTSVLDNEYNERMNLFFASNELPDVFSSNGQLTILQNATAKFTEEEYKTYMPHIYASALKQYGSMGMTKQAVFDRFSVDGKLAGVFSGHMEVTYPYGILIRKDKFDEVGSPVPSTLAEWEAFLKAYKQKYPNKYPITGKAKTNMAQSFYPFLAAYGVSYEKWHLRDNQLIYGPFLPEMREALSMLQGWYKAGYINPEWVTMDSTAMNNEWLNGNTPYTAFAALSNRTEPPYAAGSQQEQIVAKEPQAVFAYAPFPVWKDGVKPAVEVYEGVIDQPMGFGKHLEKDKEKLYAVMDVMDKLYADEELFLLRSYGIEGKHYDLVDGIPTVRKEYGNTDAKNKEGFGWYFLGRPGIDWEMTKKYKEPYYLDNLKKYAEDASGLYSKSKVAWTFNRVNGALTSPSNENLDVRGKTKKEEWGRVFAEVVIGKRSLEDFDKFIAEWKKEVGNEQTEAANRLYLKQWQN